MRKPSSWAMCPSWDGYRKRVGQPAQVRMGKAMIIQFELTDDQVDLMYETLKEWEADPPRWEDKSEIEIYLADSGDEVALLLRGNLARVIVNSWSNSLTYEGPFHLQRRSPILAVYEKLGWVRDRDPHTAGEIYETEEGKRVKARMSFEARPKTWWEAL